MPGFNRKGPAGAGPMTGRGLGLCNPRYADSIQRDDPYFDDRRGLGMRRGFNRGYGRGMGNGYGAGFGPGRNSWQARQPANSGADEINQVRGEISNMKDTLARMEDRLAALSKKGAGE